MKASYLSQDLKADFRLVVWARLWLAMAFVEDAPALTSSYTSAQTFLGVKAAVLATTEAQAKSMVGVIVIFLVQVTVSVAVTSVEATIEAVIVAQVSIAGTSLALSLIFTTVWLVNSTMAKADTAIGVQDRIRSQTSFAGQFSIQAFIQIFGLGHRQSSLLISF